MRFTGEALSAVPSGGPSAVSFASLLLRAVRMTVVGLLVCLVTLAARPMDVSASHQHARVTPVWKDSYSKRFPGCVALVLWPADQRPVAYVTRTADGAVSRVLADQGVPAGSTIGACR
jgi:hypothetical protein